MSRNVNQIKYKIIDFYEKIDPSMDMKLNLNKFFCRRSRRQNIIIAFIVCLVLANLFGAFIHPFEVDFATNFSYPLDLKDFQEVIESLKDMRLSKDNDHSNLISQLKQLPKPINEYNYRYIIKNEKKCHKTESNKSSLEDINLLIVVKSSLNNFKARKAIRKSWGFEERFSDVKIKRVFILGSCLNRYDINNCQDIIDDEYETHKDIVQLDFVDSYYNNTIKTMVSFKWAVDHCSSAQYILFVDDDYYISVKNLLKHVRNPLSRSSFDDNSIDSELMVFDGRLYTGFVFPSSPPMRHKISKWFVSLEEYPYDKYPPYVTAGAFVLTNLSLVDMHFASYYTKHFRFDDIYVSILAKKLSITPIHNKNFHFWPFSYDTEKYSDVIAAHGFGDPKHLLLSWNQQKSFGNA